VCTKFHLDQTFHCILGRMIDSIRVCLFFSTLTM
jgi:hypothetical protein